MTKIKNLYGLILAGGFSRRMGQDKALLVYNHKPQIECVSDLLNIYCEKVFLSKRPEQQSYADITPINDDPEFLNIGPLGGILSAMKSSPHASWLVMACDLPFVSQDTLQTLIQYRDPQKIATAFKSTFDGLPEPLCAIWEGESYLKIKEWMSQGVSCPRKILINNKIQLLEQTNPHWLDNVNDMNEFNQALHKIKDHI